jgi:curved DNA-binding protein CbpA
MLPSDLDPYAVLEVHPAVEHHELKAAYRALARRYHPDVAPTAGARARMVAINRAWELVSDPARRADLDHAKSVARGAAQATARVSNADVATASSPVASPLPGFKAGQQPAKGWAAGANGPPPGNPSGSVVDFGIYLGWSLGEILRHDPIYVDWLSDRPEGRPYRDEIERLRGRSDAGAAPGGRSRFGSG